MLNLPLAPREPIELPINNFLWSNIERPTSSCRLLMTDLGLQVHFDVIEQDCHEPLTTALIQQEPMLMVCQDSAVELFLAFADNQESAQDGSFMPMLEQCLYINIEINSLGICYAKHGHSRKGRIAFTSEEIKSLNIQANSQEQGKWSIDFNVPRSLIAKLAKYDAFANEHVFALNLYKISESKEHEHFVAYNPINEQEVPTPNFHLPQYFARCMVKA